MLGKLISHKTEGNEVKLTFEKGEAALRVLTPEIINVFLPRETKDHRSKAIEGEKAGGRGPGGCHGKVSGKGL